MRAENVSNEKLLKDIDLTQKECCAYINLYKSFKTLAELPENIGTMNELKYLLYSNKYLKLATECNEFAQQLNEFKLERNL